MEGAGACKINAPFCSAEISAPPVTKLPNIERGRRGSVSQPQSPLANNIDTDAGESVAGVDERFLCKRGILWFRQTTLKGATTALFRNRLLPFSAIPPGTRAAPWRPRFGRIAAPRAAPTHECNRNRYPSFLYIKRTQTPLFSYIYYDRFLFPLLCPLLLAWGWARPGVPGLSPGSCPGRGRLPPLCSESRQKASISNILAPLGKAWSFTPRRWLGARRGSWVAGPRP